MFAFDWTVNVSNILQMIAIIGGGMLMFFKLKSDVNILKINMVNLEKAQEHLNEAFKQLGIILTKIAVQDNRLGMLEKNVDELRHGQGFIQNV